MSGYPPVGPPPNYGPSPYPPRSPLPRLTWLLVALLIVWLAPYLVERIEFARTRGRERAEAESAAKQLPEEKLLGELSRAFGLVAKRIGPSVVHVKTTRVLGAGGVNDELASLFGRPQMIERDEGSGVIVDSAGFILTNNHVIELGDPIEVGLSDGRRATASVVGADPATDLAVLKIDASDLIAAEWGDSDALEVGAMVWAIGNPFGLDRSISFGIVSAKNRRGFEHNPYQDFLQTDAAVNPGNSGGPLVNIEGQLVGINTAIIGKGYQGISFAIPSSSARDVYEKLKANGRVARAWLGVQLDEATPDLARKLQLPSVKGALVLDVRPGAPGAKAGLRVGDFIVAWNDQPVDGPGTLSLLVAKTPIGSTAKATLFRDGAETTLDIQVEARPEAPRRR
jgi:S1-C subfamily serine protease